MFCLCVMAINRFVQIAKVFQMIAETAYTDFVYLFSGWEAKRMIAGLNRLIPVVSVVLGVVSVAEVSAAPAPVSRTGRVTSIATGDDGDVQPGVAWPAPRFVDNTNGTITDNLTGLVWLKNANCTETVAGINKSGGALSWANGLASASCGLSDGSTAGQWRMPNAVELEGLIDLQKYNPALPDPHPFLDLQQNLYWSSSNNAFKTYHAWVIDMRTGELFSFRKVDALYLLPVRDGQPQNGICGSSNGAIFNTAPVSGLCLSGVASTVSGTGPWSWNCLGIEGGTTDNCTANIGYDLLVTLGGAGAGTVTSNPAVMTCSSGNCSAVFIANTLVALTATADSLSTVGGWTGCISGSGKSCDVVMDATKNISVQFNLAPKAMIGTTPYGSFDAAYDAAPATGSTIQLLEDVLPFSRIITKPLILEGGYAADFTRTTSGFTTLQTAVTLGSGTVVFDRIVIQ